jgi:hypothetical protein
MRIIILITIIILSGFGLKAQNRVLLEDKDEIIKQAILELDNEMTGPDGSLFKAGQKYKITGEYNLQLTIRDKGQIVSVFVADKKDGNIPSQNRLKDEVLALQFSFKMPKNKDYKFNYTFKF